MRTQELAPAKINLALDILGRRADGYHELRMVMQTVSLCDVITVEEGGTGFTLLTGEAFSLIRSPWSSGRRRRFSRRWEFPCRR